MVSVGRGEAGVASCKCRGEGENALRNKWRSGTGAIEPMLSIYRGEWCRRGAERRK
jgi:hypothetical protein